jgi:hypothetical protein
MTMRMSMPQMSRQLRVALENFLELPHNAGLEWLDEQARGIASLSERMPNSICLETKACHATSKTNCYMQALGLTHECGFRRCRPPIPI